MLLALCCVCESKGVTRYEGENEYMDGSSMRKNMYIFLYE
jgi:hypothetical protein